MTNNHLYPKTITLSTWKKVRCGKVEIVLQYHAPKQHDVPEAHAHHLLFIFYRFRYKEDLKAGELNSYWAKLQEPGVINVINESKSLIGPFGDLVDKVFLNFWSDLPPSCDLFI